jgi:hypothetical protein
MIRPTKYSHPDSTVINVSLILLKKLKMSKLVKYDDLRDIVKKNVLGGDALFVPSLNFLYLFGLIEYRLKTDSFEYVGPNETI